MKVQNEKLLDPKDIEIKLSFTNYKLLKKEEYDLRGSYIYFIKGPNEIGKTSILQALKAAHEIKDETHKKVTLGESEGVNQFVIPGPGNKIYTVVYEFTDSNARFVVFDTDGNKISKITDMRNIFKYNHIDATSFMAWSHTAEGRRKQKEHILKLLPNDELIRYTDIENDELSLFTERTKAGKELELQEKLVKEYTLTDEEEVIQSNLETAIDLLNKKETEYNDAIKPNKEIDAVLLTIKDAEIRLKHTKENIDDIDGKILELTNQKRVYQESLIALENTLKLSNDKYKELDEGQKITDTEKEQLRLSVIKGRDYVVNARELRKKYDKFTTANELFAEKHQFVQNATEKINALRKEKEEIITKGNFPVDNISFDEEGYLNINGLRFDENQTCESDAILLIAQIMCKINETPIQILGDASLLDYEKLDRLYDIAEENGKIMFVDEVDRNIENLVIVGYERHTKKEPIVTKRGRPTGKSQSKKEELNNNKTKYLF